MKNIKNIGVTRRIINLLALLTLVLFVSGAKPVDAETVVGSTVIVGDEVWNDPEYTISGEVRIDRGNSLKISSNSNITILPSARFSVYGGQLDFLGGSTFIHADSDSSYPNITAIQVTNGVLNIAGKSIISNRQFINSYGSSTILIDGSKISGTNSNAVFANIFHNARFSLTNSSVDSANLRNIVNSFDGVSVTIDNDKVTNFQGEAFVKSFGNSLQPKSFLNITNSQFKGGGDFSNLTSGSSQYNPYNNLMAMVFANAEISISSSSFTGLDTAINIFSNARANITNSEFTNNYNPLFVRQSSFNIKNSSLVNSTILAIDSSGGNTIATENWWGTPKGPISVGSLGGGALGIVLDASRPRVSDDVLFNPWLLKSPKITEPICCSSIFFIPGIKGSRLYQSGMLSENQLWVPNRENDVDLLKMDSNGNSIGSPIYTRDVVDSVVDLFGQKYDMKPYEDFIDQMKSWQKAGDIKEYFNFAYDWRLRPDEIVESGTLYDGGIKINPVGEILRMAKDSKNGKVAIITHSNGGLLSKYIVQKLADLGHVDVIEKVVNVAMPEFGAPQAIASLLHGEGESIAGGLVLSDTVARDFAKNIPTVYNLLPSEKYFTLPNTKKDVIQFNGASSIIDKWRTQFSDKISSHSGLTNFLLADKLVSIKSQAGAGSINVPAAVNNGLVAYARKAHEFLDKFTFPASIPWFSIQAIGKTTLAGLRYFDNEKCPENNPSNCTKIPGREAVLSTNGDGVVIATKGQNDSSVPNLTRINVQLDKSNEQNGLNLSHSEIMRDSATKKTIGEIIYNTFDPNNTGQFVNLVSSAGTLPSGPMDLNRILRKFTVFSPVTISVMDKNGKTSGVSFDSITGRMAVKQEIPNSTYVDIGESKSVIVPANADFQIKIEGYDTGTFSFEDKVMSESTGSDSLVDQASVYFKDIPTTDLTTADYFASAILTSIGSPSTGTSSTLVFTGEIKIDTEGDGVIDVNIQKASTNSFIPETNIGSTTARDLMFSMISKIRGKIASSLVPESIKKRVLEKVAKLEKKITTKFWKESDEDVADLISQYSQYLNSGDIKKLKIRDRKDPASRLFSSIYFYSLQISQLIEKYTGIPPVSSN